MEAVNTYADFACNVMGYMDNDNSLFTVINTRTKEVIHTQQHQPFTTIEGQDAFYRALYNVKFANGTGLHKSCLP